MIYRGLRYFCILVVFTACGLGGVVEQNDRYVLEFYLDDTTSVTLVVDVNLPDIVINNGGEKIPLKKHSEGCYGVPVFGGAIQGSWIMDVFYGAWIDSSRVNGYSVPLKITRSDVFVDPGEHKDTTNTSWDTSIGILNLRQFGDSVLATVLTPTGDFRFLSGTKRGRELVFGTFDGAHLFHFSATIKGDSIIDGVFKSGTHYTEEWSGVRGEGGVSWSREQSARHEIEVDFTGVNKSGVKERWTRERIRREGKKLLVVDVMGTWCPNCLDEGRLMVELAESYPDVLFLSVAFERGGEEVGLSRISSYKNEVGVRWGVLYGGSASKVEADSVMRFLGGVRSFPTTAFVPLSGEVVVHTGFCGPATGAHYDREVEFFKSTIEEMLSQ